MGTKCTKQTELFLEEIEAPTRQAIADFEIGTGQEEEFLRTAYAKIMGELVRVYTDSSIAVCPQQRALFSMDKRLLATLASDIKGVIHIDDPE